MANKDASFGLKPVKMIGGAPYNGGQSRYRIAANYGTSIWRWCRNTRCWWYCTIGWSF